MKKYLLILAMTILSSNAFATQVDGRFIKDASITSAKLATGAVNSLSILDNSVGAAKIRLENDTYLRARNFAGNGDVNTLKVDTSNRMLFETFPHTPSSTPVDQYDVSNKKYVDDQVATVTPKTWLHEVLALSATDITNQYKDTTQDCILASVAPHVLGLHGSIGTDYTLTDLGATTRISFTATTGWGTGSQQALIAGDAIDVQCQY